MILLCSRFVLLRQIAGTKTLVLQYNLFIQATITNLVPDFLFLTEITGTFTLVSPYNLLQCICTKTPHLTQTKNHAGAK
jgi:hypothetical protein